MSLVWVPGEVVDLGQSKGGGELDPVKDADLAGIASGLHCQVGSSRARHVGGMDSTVTAVGITQLEYANGGGAINNLDEILVVNYVEKFGVRVVVELGEAA